MGASHRALVVDDEPLARVNLSHALGRAGWEVLDAVASAAAARRVLAAREVDVVFLDVQMPEEDGLSLARELAGADGPVVVFVTAHDRYAVAAFEVRALDYLQKPVDDARLARTLVRAGELVDLRERAAWSDAVRDAVDEVDGGAAPLTRVCVRGVGRLETVVLADVRRFTSAGNYVELHVGDRVVLHRASLSALAARLDPALFVQTHRTTVVRRDRMRALTRVGDTWELTLDDGARVPVSARHLTAVRAGIGGNVVVRVDRRGDGARS